ncbi:MAG: adenosylcobinamide-GDP ribazoletransferase, partial [Candidatus Binatia bacterium]
FSALSKKASSGNSSDSGSMSGFLAVLLIVLFKTHAIAVIGENRALSLLLTPLLARWCLVLFLFGSRPSANDTGARIAESVRSWHLIVASVATLGFALFIAGEQALWVALALSVLALFARTYLHRKQGGVSLANCGALIALSEALSFTFFASL